jgi:hypothetical protein
MEKINIAELLKDCPSGMELDCTMCDKFVLVGVDNSLMFPIKARCKDGCLFALTKYGQCCDSDYAKCVIFPKGKTTWEGFVPPYNFKEGDVVISVFGDIHLLRTEDSSYCAYRHNRKIKLVSRITTNITVVRLASEEEKQKLFDSIKANGYKWNEETKTLEKLIEPKFDITALKPFESRVLVRDKNSEPWVGQFFSHFDASSDRPFVCIGTPGLSEYKQCIPYEGNEHLFGKTDDCNENYKTWE